MNPLKLIKRQMLWSGELRSPATASTASNPMDHLTKTQESLKKGPFDSRQQVNVAHVQTGRGGDGLFSHLFDDQPGSDDDGCYIVVT
jgi:hypothetical protein